MLSFWSHRSQPLQREFDAWFRGIPNTALCNKTLQWFSTDSPERCEPGLENSRIDYRFNSDGYRSEEFEGSTDSVLSIGCSHTLGVGVDERDVSARIIANSLGLANLNLGWPGASNCYVSRMTYQAVPLIGPEIVVVNFAHSDRLECFDINGRRLDYRSDADFRDQTEGQVFRSIRSMASDYERIARFIKNFRLVASVLKGKRWVYSLNRFDEDDLAHRLPEENRVPAMQQLDLARDQMHPGIESHRKHAENVLKALGQV